VESINWIKTIKAWPISTFKRGLQNAQFDSFYILIHTLSTLDYKFENWCGTIAKPPGMSEQKPINQGSKKDRVLSFKKKKGANALAVLDPSTDTKDPKEATHQNGSSSKLESSPVCMTQDPVPPQFHDSDPFQIFVGLFTSILRWKKGSTVNFAAYSGGYPNSGDAVYAANQLNKAALEWNGHNVGVQFKWVGKLEDAAFVLAYGGDKGGVLASAYFPNSNDLNTVYVYKRGFDPDTKANMSRFFLHELGHVLGLRHEFAMDPYPDPG